MKRSRFAESQIVAILKEAEAGMTVRDVCRRHGISHGTYHTWKSKYGGLEASDLKRIRELEVENARLKQLYAELLLENASCRDGRRNGCRSGSGNRWKLLRCRTWSGGSTS